MLSNRRSAAPQANPIAMPIQTLAELRALYAAPTERALKKQLSALDGHCQRFIALSPFVVMSTAGPTGALDASPRGGAPGFIRVPDAHTLLIPDAPGNNRLDSLDNIIASGQIGLIFLIPGVDETLRVNGSAVLSTDPDDIARCTDERRVPKLVIRVQVRDAYLHCAKALMRSRLWSPDSKIARSALPTSGEMLADHTGIHTPLETQAQMAARYAPDL